MIAMVLLVFFASGEGLSLRSLFSSLALTIFDLYLLIRFIPMLSPVRHVMPFQTAMWPSYGYYMLLVALAVMVFPPFLFWFAKKIFRICFRHFYLPRAVRTAATQYANHTYRLANSPKEVRRNAHAAFQTLKQHRGAKLLIEAAKRFEFDLALEDGDLTPGLRQRQTRLFRLMGVFLESVAQASSLPQYREMLEDVVTHTKEAHKSLYEKTMAQIQQTSGEAQFHDLVERGNAIAGACGRVVFCLASLSLSLYLLSRTTRAFVTPLLYFIRVPNCVSLLPFLCQPR